jgi:periplasmic glucans biosynthesis protein
MVGVMLTRRTVCLVLLELAALQLEAAPFDFSQVREQARSLSQQPFQERSNRVPAALIDLNYVQYQSIQFRHEFGLWAREGLPFEVEFFLPGSTHKETMVIHEVTAQGVRRIPFSAELFNFGTNRIDLPRDLDYAGFKVVHPAQHFGEVASFLGASYFRMAGKGETFGASARGLALNTTDLGHEEFPFFHEFWLRKPGVQDSSLVLWALLDSASATGAFEFTITPGQETVAETKASFFVRRQVGQFGVAPLTSMFLYDQNSHPPFGDFRPEVHDSDGLLLENGQGQVFWRPLDSTKMARFNAYHDVNPKGFGLMQRGRSFEQYQDLVARFELRPSVWVRPLGNWGEGAVQLLQLPTNIEYTDNIVAFWAPAQPPKMGEELNFTYRVHWLTNQVGAPSLGYVRATRIGTVAPADKAKRPNLRFVIDFDGEAMQALSAKEQVDAEVHYGAGTRLVADTVVKDPVNGRWRLVVEITGPDKAVDLQALLKRRNQPITETWMYTWQP